MSSKLTKSEKTKSKFTQLNINHVYKGNTSETHHKPAVRQYGMQVVGKLQGTRRLPPPAWVPSLKAETGGLDPRVSLVPAGGSGWGTQYSGVNSNEADPTHANNELSPSLDSLANSAAYSSVNCALVREAIGTSFEPAFARQNFAHNAKVTTESTTGTSEETMVSTVAKVTSDNLKAVEGNQVAVSAATCDAQLPTSSQRSQSTVSGGLAANVPFFQRPTPVVTASTTTPNKSSVDSVAVSSAPACSKGTYDKVTDWASVPNGEEPNYNEKLLFSDEEDVQEDPRDEVNANQAVCGRESTHEEVGRGGTTSTAISAGASTWASSVRSGSTATDHSGLVPGSRLFPNVPDTWQTPDPTTLESVHCSPLPGHHPFVPPPASIGGASLNHDIGDCVPLDVHYLSNVSSAHVQPSYKDPYFQQTISSRLMETSISNRIPDTGLVTGDSEVELQNFQRQARTKEFKSAVERAQQARNARQKSDVFLTDQTGHQALHHRGVNVSDPSVGLKYCQPVSVVPRETGSSVEPLLNNSVTTPHVLLSAYHQAAAAAAMAFSGGSSAPPRFSFSHLVPPTTGSNTSTTSCTDANSQWSAPINPNITSGTNLPSLLNSRAQYSRLDNFSTATGSSSTSQMSASASHPPAILLNPEFVERFWEILNQQQQASRPSQQPTTKTIHEGGSEIPQLPGTTVSGDVLTGSQHQYGSKCNGSSILGEYGFRADHFASACIEDSSPRAETSPKATRFITPSPDAEPLSATVSDTVNIRAGPQSDTEKSNSKLTKRVPGLMDVKVPKSTVCNLAHLWDQDDYLASGPRVNGSRGRQIVNDRGRGSASRRRGTFRPGTVDTKPADSGATTQAHLGQTSYPPHTAAVDCLLESQEGDGEVKQQVGIFETKSEQVHTDGSDSVGCNEDPDDLGNAVDTKSAGAASTRRGSTKKRAGNLPGDTRLIDGSRRFRGRGDSQHYLHDSSYNYYDDYGGSGGHATHRVVSRGSSNHFTSHRSFSNRDAAGVGYPTRYIRQLGGGSFSSRDYRRHTPASADQHTVSKSGPAIQGYRDNQRSHDNEPFSDQPRRPFTNQRKQPRDNGTTPAATDYHFSDSEELHYYRRNRDQRDPTSVPPRNRNHEGLRCDSSKNADRRKTPTGDADESTKCEPPVATSKESKPKTKDIHLDYDDDTDVPTVRVPASDTRLMSTYRQYPFSHSRGFRSSTYHRRGGKTGANGPRSTGRTNAQTQSSSRQAGTTGGFPSSRRYRELRDRHRDDGRDDDGGGAAAGGGGGGSRSGTNSGGTGTTSGGGSNGKSGHTVSSGGGVGARDDNCQLDGGDMGDSNENNAQLEQNLQQSAYTSYKTGLTAGHRSVRSSNHSTSEGSGGYHRVHRRQQRHRFHPSEMTDNYRQVYSPQKQTHRHQTQNIPPLMSIKPTGPFARNPDHFDAVLNLGCYRSSKIEVNQAVNSPQMDSASVKSDVYSSTDQEEAAMYGDNGRPGADDREDDRGSFVSDGFTEVVSKASKRLARLRLQQEAAAAATATSATPSGRHPSELRKHSTIHSSQRPCRPTTMQRLQEQQTKDSNSSRNAKKTSTTSATVFTRNTTRRSGELPSIKATFLGPPLSSLFNDAASNSGAEQQRSGAGDNSTSGALVSVSDSSFAVWTSHDRHQQRNKPVVTTTATAMVQEPRTWSKVVGTKSSSGSSATVSSELKHPGVTSNKSGSGGVSSSSLPRDDRSCETPADRAANKDVSSLMQEKISSTPSSRRSDGSDVAEAQKTDGVMRCEKSVPAAVTEKRQVCTVSATSAHPSVSCTTVLSSPKSSSDTLLTVPLSSVSQNSCSSLNTVAASPSPVVVVVPVSSNNICKVRPQQQQQRSPTDASVSVTSTGSLRHPQSSTTIAATNSVANVNAAGGCGESGVVTGLAMSASLVPTDAACHDVDREYVDLALSVVGSGGRGRNPAGTLHEQQPLHTSWSGDAGGGGALPAVTNSSACYGKFVGSQQSTVVEPGGGTVARSFWPISEQPVQLGSDAVGGQSCSRGEVCSQPSSQFNVRQPDHAAMSLFPTDFAGNKGSSLPSALHGLYPLQVNFTGQSLPAPAMESYGSGTVAYAGGTASSFNDFTCKVPPSHVSSPTQQQHPALGNSSIYIAPPLLHSSVTMGGASQQAHSYPVTTNNWTALSMNHAHPSQQALLHSRQQRPRHRPAPSNAVDSPAPFSGFSYHQDAQNDYAFLQSSIPSAPNSGLYSSVPAHPHPVYVPPNSRSWSLLGAPTATGGAGVGSLIRSQDYHLGITGMTGASFAGASGAGVGGNSSASGVAAGGGAVGLLPHPIPPAVGSGRVSTDYATPYGGQPSSAVVSSSNNVVFSAASSLINHNYVGVIGGGRPVATTGASPAELGGRADQLALSLRHRAAGGQQPGLFQPLHTAGGGGSAGVIAGLADSSLSSSAATHHTNQLAAVQQPFPVHSTFYTSSSHQQQQRLQQQLSQFAVCSQSAVARAAAAVNSVTHHHHGLVGGPPGATGLYATFGTPPPHAPAPGVHNQPTPPPMPAHPGPPQLAPTALRHGVDGWQWWA